MSFQQAHQNLLHRMVRVNQAGEFGASRIYAGQLSILRESDSGACIQEMADQEQEHLEAFDRLCEINQVSKTKMTPIWHILGYGLGVVSARLGERGAMACTVGVEEVIDEHYQHQLESLRAIHPDYQKELQDLIEKCRADEIHHRDIGIAHQAERLPGYGLFKGAVKLTTRFAIAVSERI